MLHITLDMFQTSALAMAFFAVGHFLTLRIRLLRRYCIPPPVTGGLIFSLAHLLCHNLNILSLSFDTSVQTLFMTVFFTSIGYTAGFALIKQGGSKVFTFLGVAAGLIFMQNVAGCVVASMFGIDPRLGVCSGSISMVGGHGTAASYGQVLEAAGLEGASVAAIACATFGLVAGSAMGGPVAESVISKFSLKRLAGDDSPSHTDFHYGKINPDSFIQAAVYLLVAAGMGTVLTSCLNGITVFGAKLTFPVYIGAMVVAAFVRNFFDWRKIRIPSSEIHLWGNASLSIFLSIALMSLKLWELASLAVPIIAILSVQIVIMFIFARFVMFNVMGRDYEAAVMSAGFCGFGMGATPNAMANMQAVVKKHGLAPQAFLIVPLVGSLFIDFINGLIITLFLSFAPSVM